MAMNRLFQRGVLAFVTLSGALALGCAGRNRDDVGYPSQPARTIIAEPGGYEDVYVAEQQYVEQQAAPVQSGGDPQVVGYDTLSDGTRVEVVTYVHTYPDPIDTYPRVYWAGNWYYNVNGDFVYWSPAYGGWVYYWGPPAPLVACWNVYYPWAPYYWGVGFYGAGWYWGGVGYYGYHAYGLPVVHEHHHHHHQWSDAHPGGPSSDPGGSSKDPSTGGPADGPARRKRPDETPVARRNLPEDGAGDAPRRDGPSRSPDARDPAKQGASPPQRDGGDARKRADAIAGTGPQRGESRPSRTVPVRTYETGSGQRVTTIDPNARVTSTAPSRTPRTVGTIPASQARDPFSGRDTAPSWDQPVAASPARPSSPQRSSAPSRAPSAWDSSPSRDSFSPSRGTAPSRSYSPTPSGPSRSSAPSRSYSPPASSPSRSYSPPSRSSSPSRSYSPPSRSSSPSRSMSPPSRSAPSRSSAPSGGGRSFSPSRSSGPSRSSAPTRSSGGGGGRRR